jgi:hypothetical protein
MSNPKYVHTQVRLLADEVEALDSYRAQHKVPPSRQRAAEQLVRSALRTFHWTITKANEEANQHVR